MRYDASGYKKHKGPKNFGSLCPESIRQADAQALLDTSVLGRDGVRYNIQGRFCFRAFRHRVTATGEQLWHGHPIRWRRLPPQAARALIAARRVQAATYAKALRQDWGQEYET